VRVNNEQIRKFCLSLPHATETVQWGADLVFKIAGKMFCVVALEPSPVALSFKTTAEDFAELTERKGIIPAPYLARHHWVGLQTRDALSATELKERLRQSYDLVFDKLPRKTRIGLTS
jgi:predicted DNA-binding protein (MmcQ/YjbR family)